MSDLKTNDAYVSVGDLDAWRLVKVNTHVCFCLRLNPNGIINLQQERLVADVQLIPQIFWTCTASACMWHVNIVQ